MSLCTVGRGASLPAEITIDPDATFLTTSHDTAADAPAILLADYNLHAGDIIRLSELGSYSQGSGSHGATNLIGVFSSSSIIDHSGTDPNFTIIRTVHDAIDAGTDVVTPNTSFNGRTTDIPQDFQIDVGANKQVDITIPTGATYLFFSTYDSYYADNTNDASFRVGIALAPEPASLGLIGLSALLVLPGRLARRRRR